MRGLWAEEEAVSLRVYRRVSGKPNCLTYSEHDDVQYAPCIHVTILTNDEVTQLEI